MISRSPVLTVRRDFARPDPSLIARFAGVAAVHVVDAMGGHGALDYRIKPLDPNTASFAGPALTCHAGADDTDVAAGLRVPDFVQALLDSDQVQYLDSPRQLV